MLLREAYMGVEVRSNGWNRKMGSWPMENNLAGSRILIVEDESPLRLSLAEFLSDEGFAITEAESGDRAIVLLDGCETFDLVFTDISLLGRADGNAVADKAKQRGSDIPVLYASACKESLTNKIGPNDAFLEKPCKLHDIITVVQRLLSLAASVRGRS
jgi:CheY-like chemotaxis protein